MAEETALQYWTRRLQWAPNTATRVWWPGIERALKSQKQSLKIGITKLSTGHIPVAHKMKQWGLAESNQCPFCQETETVDHLFQYPSKLATRHQEVELNTLQKFLRQKNTYPNLKDMLCKSVSAWCNQTPFFPNGLLSSWEAAVEQQKIGWR